MDNRYYWLKLKRDFFKRHDIKIIEAMQNGKDYILFYLKLLCESVDHDGNLRFSSEIPYDENMLSIITNTNIDVVRSAIKVFSQLGMMEVLDDGTYYMSEVNKMMGSAVDNDNANRQRRFRERQKELALQERYDSVTKNNESKNKSIELDKELDIEKKEISKEKSDTFETFWKAYPKKVGKEKCFNWFKSHKVDSVLLNKMLDKIEEYKNTKQWSNPQYIPHPYTWLNQGRWDDVLETDDFTSQSKTKVVWDTVQYTLEEEISFFKGVQKNTPEALESNLEELKERDFERYQIVLKALRLKEKPLGM